MSSFTSPLIVELVGADLWRLVEPFAYHVGTYPSAHIIVVEQNYLTDMITVPVAMRWAVSPTGSYGKAGVLHDWLYSQGQLSRMQCDEVFREALRVLGASRFKAQAMYLAVRIFGAKHYHGGVIK